MRRNFKQGKRKYGYCNSQEDKQIYKTSWFLFRYDPVSSHSKSKVKYYIGLNRDSAPLY